MHAARQQPPKMWSQSLLHIRTLILSLFIAALHKKGILNFVSSVLPCLFYLAAMYYYKKARRATKIMTVASAAHFSICFARSFFCVSVPLKIARRLSLPAAQL
jgi:hypothetical protein